MLTRLRRLQLGVRWCPAQHGVQVRRAQAGSNAIRAHYRFWGKPGDRLELPTLDAFLARLRRSFRIAMAPRISRIECGNFMVNTLA
jgi:hypothetical protein